MTVATRILGIVSLLCAVAAIALQAAVVGLLWVRFTEILSPTSTSLAAAAIAGFGLLVALVAWAADRWRLSALILIAGLANLGLVAGYGVLLLVTRGVIA